MTTVSQDTLQEMIRDIVAVAAPRKVILFGSHARGSFGERSDLDFLVIQDGPFQSPHQRRDIMVRLWKALARFPCPQDFLVYTTAEVDAWGQTTNHVIARALREGCVLYERP